MTNRIRSIEALVFGLVVLMAPATSWSQAPAEYGPARGSLVIVGGGNLRDGVIPDKFIELAGGKDAKFVIVPTAGGNKNADGTLKPYESENVLRSWKARGLTHVTMLHTADPKVADTAEFVRPLTDANAVWFEGGRQWNIVDSYAGTLAYKEFHRVLERGGVIGGTSAGASIQGDFLVRGAVQGSQLIVAPEPEHHKGFAFLKRSAIDQHINARNRWDDIVPLIKERPDLLGIGLSENTAVVVQGDRFEVIGAWKVAVHDNTHLYQPWEKPYYVLSAGDVYNMKTRKIEKLGIGAGPAANGNGGGNRNSTNGTAAPTSTRGSQPGTGAVSTSGTGSR